MRAWAATCSRYITATMSPGGPSCTNGTGCLVTPVPLNFGDALNSIGISLDGDPNTPGVQPPQFTARGTLGVDLALGVDLTTPGQPFLRSDGHIDLGASATISTVNATVSLGLLSASISSGSITIAGNVSLALHDTGAADGIDPLSELGAGAVDVSASGTITNPITLNASIGTGVQISGSDLNGFGAQLQICFGSDCSTSPVTLFGPGGATPAVNATFHTNADGGHDLLDSLHNATSFTNAGPNEIMSMLGQVAGFFTSIAGQGILAQQIPFTTITLGQALDYAKEFKHNFIDPLFKSGDSTKPDANGDGKVDFQDFNFSSVQDLLNRLTNALGLGSPLVSTYDPSSNTLSFNFSLDKTLGIGTGAAIASSGGVVVDSAPLGGGTQFLLVGGASTYTISYKGGAASGPISFTDDVGTVKTAVTGLAGIPSATDVKCEAHTGSTYASSCVGGPFLVLFNDGSTAILTPNEVQQVVLGADGGTFALNTGTTAVGNLSATISLANFTTAIGTLFPSGTPRVACANGNIFDLCRRAVPDHLRRFGDQGEGRPADRDRQLAAHGLEQPHSGADDSGRHRQLLARLPEQLQLARADRQAGRLGDQRGGRPVRAPDASRADRRRRKRQPGFRG